MQSKQGDVNNEVRFAVARFKLGYQEEEEEIFRLKKKKKERHSLIAPRA